MREKDTDLLIDLRRDLHRTPELSGEENQTSARIIEFLNDHATPDEIYASVGGTGVIAEYRGSEEGPTIMFRAELDALPIREINEFDHRSSIENVSHKCGHDGHATILTGLAMELSADRPKKGKVLVLYQPAEETGEGAQWMASTETYKKLNPEMVFALHNLPGYPMHQIVLRRGVFASASTGMIIDLKGRSSHAGEPEKGNSPAIPATDILRKLQEIPTKEKDQLKDFCLITPIHLKLGEQAFGTTPGEVVAMFTLRSYRNVDMDYMKEKAVSIAREIAKANDLDITIDWTESFQSTRNADRCVDLVEKSAKENGLEIEYAEEPFRWSEDFGVFSQMTDGCLFGLGAGEKTPALHNPDYDFPDELIKTGTKVFNGVRKYILE